MFIDAFRQACRDTGGCLCVGLDPHLDRIPDRFDTTAEGVHRFLCWIIEQTAPYASAYKPNAAFFEVLGAAGMDVLKRVIEEIHAAGRPVILDAKRGDISSTAKAYARAAFDVLGADAITVVPYMGEDAIVPFLEGGGYAFVLTLPTNPSSPEIVDHGEPPLYERVTRLAGELNRRFRDQVGLVVGATRPAEARRIHEMAPELGWLVPGIGAQGASVDAFGELIADHDITVVNASRAVLFADDPANAAWELAERTGGKR